MAYTDTDMKKLMIVMMDISTRNSDLSLEERAKHGSLVALGMETGLSIALLDPEWAKELLDGSPIAGKGGVNGFSLGHIMEIKQDIKNTENY